jgi:hypothetical protein
MSELGRISGPLLKDNLVRNDIDLSFETDLLYLDVTRKRIGIHTPGPTNDLTIVGTTNIGNDITVSYPIPIGNIVLGIDGSISSVVGTLTLEANSGSGTIYTTKLATDQLTIQTNTISSDTNTDIIIDPTVNLNIRSNTKVTGDLEVTGSIDIDQNFTVNGILTLGAGSESTDQINFEGTVGQSIFPNTNDKFLLGYYDFAWKNVYISNSVKINVTENINLSPVANVKIYNNNEITVDKTDTDLVLSGRGTGATKVENLRFFNNSISTNVNDISITITPGSSNSLIIGGTGAIKIPNSTNYLAPGTGDLRFSVSDYRFKGRNDLGSDVTFSGIFSGDKKTYVIPETVLNANDKVTNFVVNNASVVRIQDGRFKPNKIQIDNTNITSNAITTVNNNNLTIPSNGTGSIIVNEVSFKDSTITTTSATSNLIFSVQGNKGYVKIDDTYGLSIPAGDSASRRDNPSTVDPLVSTTRFNSELGYLESYDGTTWYPSYGASPLLSQADVEETMLIYSLILGA